MKALRPFWRFYGGKWRIAPRYPAPQYSTIVEPFAGAAGYSLRYPNRDVVLVERDPVIAGIWRWLIQDATPGDVRAVPDVPEGGTVDDIDAPQAARDLVGFWCNDATVRPSKRPSAWKREAGGTWGTTGRERVASQLLRIKHWTVIEGEYENAPPVEATWFIDPPYSTKAGSYYVYQPQSFDALADWCVKRRGQVMVCEQEGAAWLPFKSFHAAHSAPGRYRPKKSAEVLYYKEDK